MTERSLSKPEAPAPITEYKASLLCKEWTDLDSERRELERKAAALGREQSAIKTELLRFVDDKSKPRMRTVTLNRWRLSVVQVKKSVSWIGEFTARLGQTLVDEIKANVGTRDSLSIEAIEPPTRKRRARES